MSRFGIFMIILFSLLVLLFGYYVCCDFNDFIALIVSGSVWCLTCVGLNFNILKVDWMKNPIATLE